MNRKKSCYTSMMAAAAAMLFGCADVAAESAEISFKDVKYVETGKQNTAYTPEQMKYHADFSKKLDQEIRNNMVWKGKFAEADKELAVMIADKKITSELRGKAILLRLDSAIRAKDYADAVAVADQYLKQYKWAQLTAADIAAIMRQKAYAQDRLKQYGAKAETLFARLKYLTAENDIFQTKREIISACDYAGKKQLAINLAKELEDSVSGDNSKLAVVLDQQCGLYQGAGQLEQALDTLKKLDAVQPDKNKVAHARRRIANAYTQAKPRNLQKTVELYMVSLSDKNISPATAVDMFCSYIGILKGYRYSKEYRNVPKVAQEKIFSIKNLDAGLYGRASAELMKFSNEYLKDSAFAAQYAKSVLAYPKMPLNYKIDAVKILSIIDAEKGDYINAEKMVLDLFADENCKQNNYMTVCQWYAKILSWQEKCDEAVKFLRSKATTDWYKSRMNSVIADTYLYFNRYDDAAAVWKEAGDLPRMVGVYREIDTPKAKELAEKILRDASRPEKVRSAMMQYFLSTSAKDVSIRKEFADLMKFINPAKAIQEAVSAGAWDQVLELYAVLKQKNISVDQNLAKDMVQTYATTGQYDELVKFTESEKIFDLENGNSRLKQPERITYVFAAKVLKNVADKKGAFQKYFKDWEAPAAITEKDKADMLLKTASLALAAKRDVLAQDIYDAYLSLFKEEPCKTYEVEFVDTPIIGIKGFLAMDDEPEVQLMDRKYGGNMDFLVTDVATGNRGAAIETANAKEQQKPTEMQIACDERGIHFLFSATDSKALEAEAGLAGMGSYEMYLSPGENQPYYCILPDLNTGTTTSIWNSSYKTAQWRSIKAKAGQTDITTEQIFHKDGYQVYMRLSWEKFYDKLPENGKTWDFENIHWSRFGGSTWNGLKTIHGRSTWGKLSFDISEDQMLKIKKRIIFAARKAYLKEKSTNGRYHGAIDRMKNDAHLGDAEFYQARGAAIVEKLDSYLPLVTADMDDDTINKVFNEAVPGWFEIPFILADQHRRWMEEKLTK